MKKRHNIAARLLALIVAAITLSSCDKMIYQYEGDCDPHYKARFVFDYNMLYADAFPHGFMPSPSGLSTPRAAP